MYVSGYTVPFHAVYPVITQRDRGPFANDEGLFVQFVLKPQPRTTSPYQLTILPADDDTTVRVCGYAVTHVGANFPCVQVRNLNLVTFK